MSCRLVLWEAGLSCRLEIELSCCLLQWEIGLSCRLVQLEAGLSCRLVQWEAGLSCRLGQWETVLSCCFVHTVRGWAVVASLAMADRVQEIWRPSRPALAGVQQTPGLSGRPRDS